MRQQARLATVHSGALFSAVAHNSVPPACERFVCDGRQPCRGAIHEQSQRMGLFGECKALCAAWAQTSPNAGCAAWHFEACCSSANILSTSCCNMLELTQEPQNRHTSKAHIAFSRVTVRRSPSAEASAMVTNRLALHIKKWSHGKVCKTGLLDLQAAWEGLQNRFAQLASRARGAHMHRESPAMILFQTLMPNALDWKCVIDCPALNCGAFKNRL